MCQIFCCNIIQEVSFNYHQRNVRSRTSRYPAFMTKSRSRLEIWARSRRLRFRLNHCNLPWRASGSNHQVQRSILTFEALLRKNTYLLLERGRKSNNRWLRALMQSDCLYSSLFFEHYNRILLCEWVIGLYSVCLIDSVSCHNTFAVYLASTSLGTAPLLRSSVETNVVF